MLDRRSLNRGLLAWVWRVAALLVAMQALAAEPENGWWWGPDRPGSGLNLELQNDLLLVGYFDEVSNGRVAYNAFCVFDGVACGGEFLAGSKPTGILFELSFPNSAVQGQAVIGGDRFAIKRFQLGFEEPPVDMLGTWLITIMTGPATTGEQLVLDQPDITPSGVRVLRGQRVGTGQAAAVSFFPGEALPYVIAVEDSATTFAIYQLSQQTGLNAMSGEFVITDAGGNPRSDTFDALAVRRSQQAVEPAPAAQAASRPSPVAGALADKWRRAISVLGEPN